MTKRLPITAIVVSRNEGGLLERCLPTIRFCDEILVVDLESTDRTVAVAAAHGAVVIHRPVESTVERVRLGVFDCAAHDWVLTTDPDEELPAPLARVVALTLPSLAGDVAVVYAPIRYHFRDRPLSGTTWGGERHRRLLVRRSGVELTGKIYSGVSLRPGAQIIELPFTEETAIVHHWATGWRDLIAKHRRYLAQEPADRAAAGHVTGLGELARTPWRSFHESFISKQGYRDGFTGLGLSIFYAGFRTTGEFLFLRHLRRTRS